MDKDALYHQPEIPISGLSSWQQQRKLSAEIDKLTDEFYKRGGKITQVETGYIVKTEFQPPDPNSRISEHNVRSATERQRIAKKSHEIAVKNGLKQFVGVICIKCKSYDRWTLNNKCIKCNPVEPVAIRKLPADARAEAVRNGLTIYTGKPCKRCKGQDKSVETGACLACYGPTPTTFYRNRIAYRKASKVEKNEP